MSSATPGARIGRAAASLLRPRRALAAPGGKLVRTAMARGGRHLLGAFGRVLRHLGLQISAVLYLIFALSFGVAGIKGWTADHRAPGLAHHAASLTQMAPSTQLELALALVFVYFGLSSLLRAGHRP